MFPSPDSLYPLIFNLERTVFLKNIIKSERIIVGDYTYYDDADDTSNFEKNVMYHFPSVGDKLIIGKFCQIAQGVRFLMNGIFHNPNYLTTYPFGMYDRDIHDNHPESLVFPNKGDTIIGNDVWFGCNATIMPGVHIGDGAIIGTNALVTKAVEPYSIVGGNPAKLIRKRFDDRSIERLLAIEWWNWPIDVITENISALLSYDIKNLEEVYSIRFRKAS